MKTVTNRIPNASMQNLPIVLTVLVAQARFALSLPIARKRQAQSPVVSDARESKTPANPRQFGSAEVGSDSLSLWPKRELRSLPRLTPRLQNSLIHSMRIAANEIRGHNQVETAFLLVSKYKPRGDQVSAIKALTESILAGNRYQTLLSETL
jgi:hypothetical protein